MTKKLLSFLLILFPFTLVFFGIQYFAVNAIKNETNIFYYSTWGIYVFHFFVTLLIYLSILFVNKTFPDNTGFAFMACSLLKMMASVLFLVPLIQMEEVSVLNDVFAFFIPYFLFLFVETYFALKLLNIK